jgi:5-formyltetrahydrofolate cyclo-ligase
LPKIDLVVMGSVAVTREGRRLGKGHGYADLEYALLRELGNPPVPVATTVHPLQVLDDFPIEEHDLPVSLEEALQEMPVLAELRELKRP